MHSLTPGCHGGRGGPEAGGPRWCSGAEGWSPLGCWQCEQTCMDSKGTGSLLAPWAGRAGRVSCLSLYAVPMCAPHLALGLSVCTREMGQLALTASEHRKSG